MFYKFSSEFSDYQIYRSIPSKNLEVIALNLKKLKDRIFFDLLLADTDTHRVVPVLLNEMAIIEEKGTVTLILSDIIKNLTSENLVNLYIQLIKLLSKLLQESKVIDWQTRIIFSDLVEQFTLLDYINKGNPQRRPVIGLGNYVNTLKFVNIYREISELIRELHGESKITLLDCACGTGYGSMILGELPNSTVTGMDMDEEAIGFSNLLAAKNNVRFIQSAMEDYPTNQDSDRFDVAVSVETMEHVQDPNLFLEALLGTVKEDGYVILTLPEARFHGIQYNSDHLTNWTLSKVKKFFAKYFSYFRVLVMEAGNAENPFNYKFMEVSEANLKNIDHYLILACKRDFKVATTLPEFGSTSDYPRLRVMFMAHNIFPFEKSGVPIVTHNQAMTLKERGHDVAVMIPQASGTPEKGIINGITTYKYQPISQEKWFLDDFFLEQREQLQAIEKALEDFRPDIIHINNLLFTSLKVIQLISDLGIPVVKEMHDLTEFCFFATAPTATFISQEGKLQLCTGPGAEKCTDCFLKRQYSTNPLQLIKNKANILGKFYARLNYLSYLYKEHVDLLIYPSVNWQEYLGNFIQTGKSQMVLPIGIKTPEKSEELQPYQGTLRFVYLGLLAMHKGLDILVKALNCDNLLRENFTLRIYGQAYHREIVEQIADLEKLSQGKVKYAGPYGPGDLEKIIEQADVGLVPSYLESYCITAREFIIRGKPIVAAETFGLLDIVQDNSNGLLFPVGDWQVLRSKITDLLHNRELVKELARGAASTELMTQAVEAELLEESYYSIIGYVPLENTLGTHSLKQPLVSVIIPVFNKLEYTRKCIASLAETLDLTKGEVEIIVVDNGSTDETSIYLASLPAYFRVICNGENLGFARACNQGAAMATGRYLVFLNNDTVALPGWLEQMIKVIEAEENVGIVGSKLLFPDGTIQHAGVAIAENEPWPLTPFHIFYRKPGDYIEANRFRDLQVVTGACLLIRRELFFTVGAFDENYLNGYEDVDLCLKVKQQGYRVIYCPKSVLYHHESVSDGRFSHTLPNIEHLHKKWLGKIKPDIQTSINGLTSLIIPCYNQVKYTKLCLASIFEHTREPFELILINNGSTDETKDYLKQLATVHSNLIIIDNEKNLGFGGACNQGMAQAQGDYVLILNNDVVVTAGWLTRMLKAADSDQQIGIIGPRSNWVAGVQIIKDVPYQDLKGMHEFAAELAAKFANRSFEVNRVIGLCMLIKKEVVNRIGGFDLRFGVGNYEDDDYCLRARIAGYKILVCNSVFIHHFGSKTFTGAKMNYEELIKGNWSKFAEKWGVSSENSISMGYNSEQLINQPFNKELHYCPL